MKKNGYCGKIKNSGTQFVPAPNAQKSTRKGTVKHEGGDLRTGKKSK